MCCCGGDRTRRYIQPALLAYSLSLRKLTFYRNGPCKGLCTKTALGLGLGTVTTGRKLDDLPTCTFPRWRSGPPAAWDFAITSGLRDDALLSSVTDRQAVLTNYEDFKENFKSTSTQCQQSGLSFIPMIMEASGGGWGKQARRVWSELAKKHSLAAGELTSDKDSAIQTLQRLSIILHRENARAISRRSVGVLSLIVLVHTRAAMEFFMNWGLRFDDFGAQSGRPVDHLSLIHI